jgi:predicted DNA-binding protein
MAKSRKIRVALSLPDEADSVLSEISKLTNTPKTTIVTQLVVESMPAFQSVLEAVKEAQEGRKQAAYDAMLGFVAKAHTDLNQIDLDLDQFKGKHLDK